MTMLDDLQDLEHRATVAHPPICLEAYASPSLPEAEIHRLLERGEAFCAALLPVLTAEGIPQALGLKAEGQVWEVDCSFVTNAEIHRLNAAYREKDQPTDVLTFTLLADSPQRTAWTALPVVQLGSIVISWEWAQAASNISDAPGLDHYVLERLAHGFLHLMGVHHDTLEAYNRVVGIQGQILHGTFA